MMKLNNKNDVLHIPFSTATTVSALVMGGGFVLSIILAVIYDFEHSTWTHCNVPNYLPSISAAIARPPSAYVWRLSVSLCTAQRLVNVRFNYIHYSSILRSLPWYETLCKICFSCELLEILSIVGIMCISSTENHKLHAICFTLFQITAAVFMLSMCHIYYKVTNMDFPAESSTHRAKASLRQKRSCVLMNFASFILAMYFYYRHNKYCEPGVYTLFALTEYLVVFSNVIFHYNMSMDFPDREIQFGVRISGRGMNGDRFLPV